MYNSRVVRSQVDALLARKPASNNVKCQNVNSRTIWASANSANVISHNCESGIKKCHSKKHSRFLKKTQVWGVVMKV